MVTNETTDRSQAYEVCTSKEKKWAGDEGRVALSIPDLEAIILNCSQMMKRREKVGIDYFGRVWSTNDSADKYMLFLVSTVRRVIENNPDINPGIRGLVLIELSTVNGKHECDVAILDFPFKNIVKVVATAKNIIIS